MIQESFQQKMGKALVLVLEQMQEEVQEQVLVGVQQQDKEKLLHNPK